MDPLNVDFVELYPSGNAQENHTTEFDLIRSEVPTPIFRRGGCFNFAVRFDREFSEEDDVVKVCMDFGPKPSVFKGTKAILTLNPHGDLNEDPYSWGITLSSNYGQDLHVRVHVPCNVPVGIWKFSIITLCSGDYVRRNEFKSSDDVYILFNPWCSDDGVFMEDSSERDEYILNEYGKIWQGTYKSPLGKPWVFGQFDEVCLPAAIFLLEKSGLDYPSRASPILMSRAISAVINNVDEGGVVEGRWDGQYDDGTNPHIWTGSTKIMETFLESGGLPVKYGQCWVFAGVTVTVCRALGIPCRPVTNYISAQDSNCSLTVDKYFDASGNLLKDGPDGDKSDSCWNFHVWNDVWMKRPDLPPGYGGWQIIDATPQHVSESQFKCGPASVEAIKRGEVGYMYDTPTVFSEVNADVVHFQEDPSSDWGFKLASLYTDHVGRKMITKKVGVVDMNGESDAWDITLLYKNREGSEAERLAVYNAIRGIPRTQQIYEIPNKDQEDVSFELVHIDQIPFGGDFEVVVNIKNNSDDVRNVSAVLSCSSIFYIGSAAKNIKKSQGTFQVRPGDEEVIRINVIPEEYLDKLVDHSLIKIYAIANVRETKQTWSDEDDFTMTIPKITVTVGDSCRVGEQCPVDFSFTNPLPKVLTECNYIIDCPGLERPMTVPFRDVEPNETVQVSETFEAKKIGERQIVVCFNSKELNGVFGSTTIKILE